MENLSVIPTKTSVLNMAHLTLSHRFPSPTVKPLMFGANASEIHKMDVCDRLQVVSFRSVQSYPQVAKNIANPVFLSDHSRRNIPV